MRRVRFQAEKLKAVLPSAIDLLYSLKSNASLGICDVLADCGIGADLASDGELETALASRFPHDRIFIAGPYKQTAAIERLRKLPDAVISVDSPSELQRLVDIGMRNRLVLRLRPNFDSTAIVSAGSECRFGFTRDDLIECRSLIDSADANVVGFHVFVGSQVLTPDGVLGHLNKAFQLSQQAAEMSGVRLQLLNLGGGFGIPYAEGEGELDIQPISDALATMVRQVAPAKIILELGRYFVAQSGWYLTSVVGHQTHQGRTAVVVDGGTHQRADLCGMSLRTHQKAPALLRAHSSAFRETDVLGCLSLPADVMVESKQLPPLSVGDTLAFGTAGAYGLWSSPALFHSSPLPAEVAFDGDQIQLMRKRPEPADILDGQLHVNFSAKDGNNGVCTTEGVNKVTSSA